MMKETVFGMSCRDTYDLKAAAFVNGKQIGKVTHKQIYKNLIIGKKNEIMPEPKGMKGDILG